MQLPRYGKVKFFDAVRGFGFVYDEEEVLDRHFHMTQVVGADLPQAGDVVTFLPATGPRGPKAERVTLVERAPSLQRTPGADDRDVCRSCGKRMVPRVRIVNGVPFQSFCPFCGNLHKDFSRKLSVFEVIFLRIIQMSFFIVVIYLVLINI